MPKARPFSPSGLESKCSMWIKPLRNFFKKPDVEIPAGSSMAWKFWMASESFPTLVAGYDLGGFECLAKGPRSESVLRKELCLSPRAGKVLFWQLNALGLFELTKDGK